MSLSRGALTEIRHRRLKRHRPGDLIRRCPSARGTAGDVDRLRQRICDDGAAGFRRPTSAAPRPGAVVQYWKLLVGAWRSSAADGGATLCGIPPTHQPIDEGTDVVTPRRVVDLFDAVRRTASR